MVGPYTSESKRCKKKLQTVLTLIKLPFQKQSDQGSHWGPHCLLSLSVSIIRHFIVCLKTWHNIRPQLVQRNYCYGTIWAASWQNQQCGCAPSKDSDQPGHLSSLIRVIAVRMKKVWVLSYPLSAQQRLWSDWADARLIWVFAGHTVILLVLSQGGSFIIGSKVRKPNLSS